MIRIVPPLIYFIIPLVAPSVAAANFLGPNDYLRPGQYIQSSQGKYFMTLQTDGSLVMYRNDNTIRYVMAQRGNLAIMQNDGNFVEYGALGNALWNTGTWGNPGAALAIQDDGNLVVYAQMGGRCGI